MEVTHLPLFKILAYIDFRRGEFVLPLTVYEWGNGGGGGISNFGTCLSEMWESYELIPHLKFWTSCRLGGGRSRVWGFVAGFRGLGVRMGGRMGWQWGTMA